MEKTGGRTYDIVDWIEGFFFFFFSFLFFSLVVSPEKKHNTQAHTLLSLSPAAAGRRV